MRSEDEIRKQLQYCKIRERRNRENFNADSLEVRIFRKSTEILMWVLEG